MLINRYFTVDDNGLKRGRVYLDDDAARFVVQVGEKELGTIGVDTAVNQSHIFSLTSGATLEIRFRRFLFIDRIRVSKDGKPVASTQSIMATRVERSFNSILFVAVFNVILGLLAVSGDRLLESLGAGWTSVLSGIALLPLARQVRQRSLTALLAAIGLYGVDTAVSAVLMSQLTGSVEWGIILARIIFIGTMAQGIRPIQKLAQV